ncbi:MAG: hypothetical protein DDT30_02042 [Dehalococcoidia bacterium]|nr:hypothetical protein [Bacillota bacterium]
MRSGQADLIVPIIVIAELIFLVEKGRVRADIDALLSKILEEPGYEVVPLGLEQMLLLTKTTQISEMHDRLIVCEALLHDAELITRDTYRASSSVFTASMDPVLVMKSCGVMSSVDGCTLRTE